MDALLISTVEDVPFDAERIRAILESIPGISRLSEGGINAILEAHFESGGYATIVHLKVNRRTISVAKMNEASIQLAYLIQCGYPEPLRVIDLDYSFDLVMCDFESATEMEKAMHTAIEKAVKKTGNLPS